MDMPGQQWNWGGTDHIGLPMEDGKTIQDEGEYEKENNNYVGDKHADCDKDVFVIADSDLI